MSRLLSVLGLFSLLWISFPLALLACLTTTLALSVLVLRVSVVYLEFIFAFIESWTTASASTLLSTASTPRRMSSPLRLGSWAGSQKRGVRKNIVHTGSESSPLALNTQSGKNGGSLSSIIGASKASRDFEGVGGWQLTGEAEDDGVWMTMNSRLELPNSTEQRRRNHFRSWSSQSTKFVPRSFGSTRSSDVDLRCRTSYVGDGSTDPEEHFNSRDHGRPAVSPEGAPLKKKRPKEE